MLIGFKLKSNMISKPNPSWFSPILIGLPVLERHLWKGGVRKSHIVCLNSQGATYISVGQLHLVLIGFKLKSIKSKITGSRMMKKAKGWRKPTTIKDLWERSFIYPTSNSVFN